MSVVFYRQLTLVEVAVEAQRLHGLSSISQRWSMLSSVFWKVAFVVVLYVSAKQMS